MADRSSLDYWRLAAAAAPLILGAVVGWWPGFAARATPLEAAECAQLKTEEAELTKAGVRANMAKGPKWAKSNLTPDAIERIQRLISVDEQIAFRCPRPPPPKAEAENATAPKGKPKVKAAKADAGSEGAAKASEGQTGAAVATPKPKPKPKAAASAGEDAAPAAKSAAPKAATSKAARAKTNDAYRPPARTETDSFPQ
jgi:hypothetical protein